MTYQKVLINRRARTDSRQEDKVRGKRLFGNILGTLNKFKKEDKSSRTSEAVSLCHYREQFEADL